MSTILISYAQHAEDVLLHRALGHLAEGFWVDVGAGDPEVDSVTALFAAKGWRGINIEPDPEACARLAAARPRDITLCCAAGAAPGRAVLHRIAGTGLSTLDPAIAARHAAAGHKVDPIEVELRTLAEICAAHAPPEIHFLKIDAEGHEAEVLAGADFTRHRPWVVVVEATEPNLPTPSHTAWEPQLLAAGYAPVLFDGLNRWYLAAERAAALRGAFSAPANPLDRFLRRAEVALRLRAEAAEAAARAAEEAARAARAEAEEAARARATAAAQAAAETARADAATARAAALADRVAAAEQRAVLAEQRAAVAEQEATRAADRARAAEARAAAADEERLAAAARADTAQTRAAAAEAQARSAADRAALAQQRAEAAEQEATKARQRARSAEAHAAAAEARAAAAEALAAGHARRLAAAETESHTIRQQLAAAQAERDAALARAAAAEADAAAAQARIAALLASRSWRITRPLRVLGHGLRGRLGLALMEAGVPRPRVEAWKQAWQARRRRGGAGLPTRPPAPAAAASAEGAPLSTSAASAADGRPVLCLDVTLTLRHGGRPAVGLVRVEHDIARHLLGLAEAEVLPVLCGPDGRYRLAEAEEIAALVAILEGQAPPPPPPATPAAGEALGDVLQTLGRLAALAPAERQDLARRLVRDGRLSGWLAAALVGGGVLAGRAAQALLARRGPPAAAPSPPRACPAAARGSGARLRRQPVGLRGLHRAGARGAGRPAVAGDGAV
jgi:FkbM family methyltransferase